MAILHLELDIDSDVHPELFVRLASIERSPARQEKLRQLAATGLIWEIVRLHGPAFSEPAAVTAEAPAPQPAQPDGAPAQAVDAGSVNDHPPLVPEDVPLLVDVVDESEFGADAQAALSLVPPPLTAVDVAVHGSSADDSAVLSGSPVEAPGGRTRSARMKRMKDSGLFQNG